MSVAAPTPHPSHHGIGRAVIAVLVALAAIAGVLALAGVFSGDEPARAPAPPAEGITPMEPFLAFATETRRQVADAERRLDAAEAGLRAGSIDFTRAERLLDGGLGTHYRLLADAREMVAPTPAAANVQDLLVGGLRASIARDAQLENVLSHYATEEVPEWRAALRATDRAEARAAAAWSEFDRWQAILERNAGVAQR